MDDFAIKIIAHRGESYIAPENSLAAINLAWKNGAKAVEIDIQLTGDGNVVVIHDKHTGRVADRKYTIAKSNLETIKSVDIGIKKAEEYKGEKIPTLSEVLETVPNNAKLIIEIKCGNEIIRPLKTLVLNSNIRINQIEFISFNLKVVSKIKEQLPLYKALWLLDLDYYWPHWLLRIRPNKIIKIVAKNKLDGVNVWAGKVINKSFVKAFKERGLHLYTWTVNDIEFANALLSMGVNAITTDRAAWLCKRINEINK